MQSRADRFLVDTQHREGPGSSSARVRQGARFGGLWGVAGVLVLVAGVGVQAQAPNRLAFVYTHQIEVNCESAVATQSGWIDLDTGTYGFDFRIQDFIPGYRWEGASPVTLATSSACPIAALQIGGAKNLYSLTGGNLDFSAVVTMKDELVDLRTDIEVQREGDVVRADLHTRGTANLPDVVTLESPMLITQTPNPGGGFTETGTKVLVTEDGTRVGIPFTAVYTGVDLPAVQVREVDVDFADVAPDHSCGRLNLFSQVSLADATVDVALVDQTTLRLQWQQTDAPCVIEKAPTLYGAWADSGIEPRCDGGVCEAEDAVSGDPAYYRLRCEDGHYSANVAGYFERTYSPGLSLVATPLPQSGTSLNSVLPLDDSGTGALLYTYPGNGFSIYTYEGPGIGWFPEGTLSSGQAAFLLLPQTASAQFVGSVPYGVTQLTLEGRGLSLLGWPLPPPEGYDLEQAGFPAMDGDLVYLWTGQAYESYAFLEGLGWFPEVPAPPFGSGFWLLSATGQQRLWSLPVPAPQPR